MPSSNLACWPWILNLVETAHPHRTVLDIGAGHGKAAILLREYLNKPPVTIDACEAWEPYVNDHHLWRLYDFVRTDDASDLTAVELSAYDLVLMVDVIEHMPKPEATALLHRIPGWVVICTPVEFFHNGPNLPPTEEHVSAWGQDDWDALGDRVDQCFEQLGGWFVRLRPASGPDDGPT